MTQEDKELLLRDLCARLPYNVMVDYEGHIYMLNEIDPACKDIDYITVRIQDEERLTCAKSVTIEKVKPYLRPMSSMTDEEYAEYVRLVHEGYAHDTVDYLNSIHVDYRNLIQKGLAIGAPEGMYEK